MAVFHPGTTDINQAQPVTLKEGGDVVVNLDTPLKDWTPRKIFGTAISPLTNLVPNPTTGVIDRPRRRSRCRDDRAREPQRLLRHRAPLRLSGRSDAQRASMW